MFYQQLLYFVLKLRTKPNLFKKIIAPNDNSKYEEKKNTNAQSHFIDALGNIL